MHVCHKVGLIRPMIAQAHNMKLNVFRSFFSRKKSQFVESNQKIKIVNTPKLEKANEFYIMPDGDDRYDVIMVCPDCQNFIPLSKNHIKTIDRKGKITIEPSILHKSCGAHFWIKENKIYFV